MYTLDPPVTPQASLSYLVPYELFPALFSSLPFLDPFFVVLVDEVNLDISVCFTVSFFKQSRFPFLLYLVMERFQVFCSGDQFGSFI